MKIEGKRILLTGGSSGIGFATAQILAKRGAAVLIVGRRPDALASAVKQLRSIDGGKIDGVVADVATAAGRSALLAAARQTLGGLDVLINNAGAVRAGRIEDIAEAEIRTMIEVNLVAPILFSREALPLLRANGDGLIVNIASGIGLVGVPFYATYAAVKAGIARFGEALRRELKGEGVHVLTVYPTGTDTPMMKSNRAGPDLGFGREAPAEVAAAIVAGIEADAFEIVRGGEARAKMVATNRDSPETLDERFAGIKPALADAVRDHSAL